MIIWLWQDTGKNALRAEWLDFNLAHACEFLHASAELLPVSGETNRDEALRTLLQIVNCSATILVQNVYKGIVVEKATKEGSKHFPWLKLLVKVSRDRHVGHFSIFIVR